MDSGSISYVVESDAAGERALRAARNYFGSGSTSVASSARSRETFLDTFDWRLYRRGETLSARVVEGQTQLSLSTGDGELRQRLRVARPPAFSRDLPDGSVRQTIGPVIEMRRLFPLVEISLHRETLALLDSTDKTVARLCLERGVVRSPDDGNRRFPLEPRLRVIPVRGYDDGKKLIAFLEEELGLGGKPTAPLDVALQAIGRRPCDYSSKLRLKLDAGLTSVEAARQVLRTLFETMRANEAGTRDDLDSEFLHDFRVSIRRTRSCLGQLRQTFSEQTVERFGPEFAWLGKLTGPTRDLDVWLLRLDDYRRDLPAEIHGDLDTLERHLRRLQGTEQRKLARALGSRRYRALIDGWGRFVSEDEVATGGPQGERGIREVATERIARAHRRVLRSGRGLDAGSPADRFHRLRIQCKKLRYLLEFFRSLYPEGEVRPLLSSLKRLQDNLGDYNDLEVQQAMLGEFATQMSGDDTTEARTLLTMGRLVERLAARQIEQRKQFDRLFADFAREKRMIR